MNDCLSLNAAAGRVAHLAREKVRLNSPFIVRLYESAFDPCYLLFTCPFGLSRNKQDRVYELMHYHSKFLQTRSTLVRSPGIGTHNIV